MRISAASDNLHSNHYFNGIGIKDDGSIPFLSPGDRERENRQAREVKHECKQECIKHQQTTSKQLRSISINCVYVHKC